jgi:cystathionine beta-lyase/cystathionine gamma-synthase
VDTSDPKNVQNAITSKTRLVHVETPGNPTTLISDIAAIARVTQNAGIPLSVDSTWSGLVTQHPLQLGATLVMHSITKYINGHGDALGGAVLGPKELLDKVRRFAIKDLGACISPFNAWQIMRGIVTLPMRMARHCANAMQVAEFLAQHPKVAWVRYPGLKTHPQHAIAQRQMSGFAGMLNFDIRSDAKQRTELLRRLKIFTHATSMGADESLVMVYDDYHGHDFFRLSIGLEDPQDLMADLDQALTAI